jgi:hypothetical protein
VDILVLVPGRAMGVKLVKHLSRKGVHFARVVQPKFHQGAMKDQMNSAHNCNPIGAWANIDRGSVMAPSGSFTRSSEAATMSRAGSIPGMISVAKRPFSVSRITQRSVIYITSWPCVRTRLPEKVTCSTASTILVNLPGLVSFSPASVREVSAPASSQPEKTIFELCGNLGDGVI